MTTVAILPAWLFALAGRVVERWLFFAEARHVVVSYYAAPRLTTMERPRPHPRVATTQKEIE